MENYVKHDRLVQDCVGLIEKCKKDWSSKAEGILGGGGEKEENQFYVMLRWSRPKWDGYETVDVVQIAWLPSYRGEKEIEEKKKRSATFLWDALEDAARIVGRVLRVECVLHQKFIDMLIRERFYKLQSYTTDCLLCVK